MMAFTRTDSMAAVGAVLFLGLLAGESALVPRQSAAELLPKARETCADREEQSGPFPAIEGRYYVSTMPPSAVLITGERTPQSRTERENR